MRRLGARRVMVVTDPQLAQLPPVAVVLESLKREGIDFALYDRARVEPTDSSFQEAIEFCEPVRFDGFVAVGGGSSIDTAKAANLYATYPADFLDYVNPPIGKGRPVPGRAQAADRHPDHGRHRERDDGRDDFRSGRHARQDRHRPPSPATDARPDRSGEYTHAAATGSRLHRAGRLCHAIESYTALPYPISGQPQTARRLRPAYQGANPISDVWSAGP